MPRHLLETDEINATTLGGKAASAYQQVVEKSSAGGYASLDPSAFVPIAELGSGGTGAGALFLADDHTWRSPGAASFVMTVVEKDLGAAPLYSGSFTITGAGLTIGKPVLIQQAAGPYTGKGDRADEAEMDLVAVTAYVLDATTIQAYWTAQPFNGPVAGNIKFQYVVSG
jgi:hypothetical protein